MKELNKLTIVSLVQLAFMILVAWLLPRSWQMLLWIVLIACFALYIKVSPLQSLAITLTIVLGFGFLLVGHAWVSSLSATDQAVGVVQHLSVSGCLVCTWLQVTVIKNFCRSYTALEAENRKLRKYEETNVLTESELFYQFRILHTAMKRKNEMGWIVFYAVHGPDYAVPALMSVVSQACLRGTRAFFDLVGRVSDTVLAVVLQTVDEPKCRLVVDRINKLMNEQLCLDSDCLIVSAYPIPDDWSEAERLILEKGRSLGRT